MKVIQKYFPDLNQKKYKQFSDLKIQYNYWNAKINVISRKNIDSLYISHILHSLAIAKVIKFKEKTRILDVGTGGGFPGIPLAIIFPKVDFLLVDSIGKKINVVNEIINETGIKNVKTIHGRAENINEQFDFVVSRAVTNMSSFTKLVKGKFYTENKNILSNGILYLKGGDLTDELKGISHKSYNISSWFNEDFFESKKVIYISS